MNMVIGLVLIALLTTGNVLLAVFIVTSIKTIRMMKPKGQYRLCNDGMYHWREDPDLHPVIKDLPERNCK